MSNVARSPHDTGPPDAFMLANYERRKRRARNRLRISVPLAVLTLPAAVVVGFMTGWPWIWIVIGELGALTFVSMINLSNAREPERPRPDGPVEAAVVVGIELLTWGDAVDDVHTARVIGRPLGSTADQLVYSTREFTSAQGCHIRPGMLYGYRRYPTMRHLAWTEPDQDPLALLRLRDENTWEHAEVLDGIVESVEIADETDGDWQSTTVVVRLGSSLVTDTRPRLPEELAQLEPGQSIKIARAECPVLPTKTIHAIVSRTI